MRSRRMKGRGWGTKTGLLSGPAAGQPHQGTPANKPEVLQPASCARGRLGCGGGGGGGWCWAHIFQM